MAHTQRIAVAHRNEMQVLGINFYKREIRHWICTYHSGGKIAVVVKRHLKALRSVDDMVVCNNVSVVAEYHT